MERRGGQGKVGHATGTEACVEGSFTSAGSVCVCVFTPLGNTSLQSPDAQAHWCMLEAQM